MTFITVEQAGLCSGRVSRFLVVAFAACLLTSCITTTTGGFNVKPSEEQALQDYIQLAIAYYDANDLTGARRHVNNAMDLNDRHTDVYTMLALIFQREGDFAEAEVNFRRAISLDRNNSRARNNYAVLLFRMERFEEAYEQLELVTADSNYEGRAIAFENLGRAAQRAGRRSDAETAFLRALQLNANLYVSSLELALLRFENRDWSGARQSFQQYLTTVDFYNIPHTPRALLAGIQIEGRFLNSEMVNNFSLILSTLYQDSPEFETYQRLTNAN